MLRITGAAGVLTAQGRRERLRLEAGRLTDRLVAEGARLVIVFGSLARDDVRRDSDLDLLAVMDSDEPFGSRHVRLYESLAPRVALDLLAYTPDELEQVRHRPVIAEALRHGKVLHAA